MSMINDNNKRYTTIYINILKRIQQITSKITIDPKPINEQKEQEM